MTDNDNRCPATNRDGDQCGLSAGWGTESDDGPCKFHGGAGGDVGDPGGSATEGNQRAQKHGLHSQPEYLEAHLSGSEEEDLDAIHDSLCGRYERIHGREPDYAATRRLRRISIEILKQDLADEWLASQAQESGHLLMERRETPEGREFHVPNSVLEPLTALKRETRLALKDMGLLEDPDSKQADALESLADGAHLEWSNGTGGDGEEDAPADD